MSVGYSEYVGIAAAPARRWPITGFMPRIRPAQLVSIDLQPLNPASPSSGGGLGGTRVLLVGTGCSTAQLYHALGALDPRPQVIGCVLLDPSAGGAGGAGGTGGTGGAGGAGGTGGAESKCRVLGGFDRLAKVCESGKVDLALVSLPMSMPKRTAVVADVLSQKGIAWRFMPTLADQLAGLTPPTAGLTEDPDATPRKPSAGDHACHVDLAQLIDRQPRPLDEAPIRDCLAGKVVLITGAGGSIGSELAQIVCRFNPARLILVERAENALFQIDREIARRFPDQQRHAELHDVTHAPRTLDLVDRHQPDVVLHAAAHKHVPMMEDHPAAAIENNFFGTRSIADAAHTCGVRRFVMISTDKAVNPSSVMGASKRLAELYIQHENRLSPTIYSMVRFGNVLGSACSVLPIWSRQIAQGGPVTVTHPDMTRYFMTIPEAAGLVLQAGAYAKGGEVFLLDMGEPVNVMQLAERFIRQHGMEPDEDIQVAITGVRPGEKMFEVLAYDGEDMTPTPHPSIRIWESSPPDSARLQQIALTFDRLREKNGGHQHAWRGIGKDTILNALRNALPEMVESAAG
jgi:UDP-N-acetylglucosamine 4,6-dehydratase